MCLLKHCTFCQRGSQISIWGAQASDRIWPWQFGRPAVWPGRARFARWAWWVRPPWPRQHRCPRRQTGGTARPCTRRSLSGTAARTKGKVNKGANNNKQNFYSAFFFFRLFHMYLKRHTMTFFKTTCYRTYLLDICHPSILSFSQTLTHVLTHTQTQIHRHTCKHHFTHNYKKNKK